MVAATLPLTWQATIPAHAALPHANVDGDAGGTVGPAQGSNRCAVEAWGVPKDGVFRPYPLHHRHIPQRLDDLLLLLRRVQGELFEGDGHDGVGAEGSEGQKGNNG